MFGPSDLLTSVPNSATHPDPRRTDGLASIQGLPPGPQARLDAMQGWECVTLLLCRPCWDVCQVDRQQQGQQTACVLAY